MPSERWLPLQGYENTYLISNQGRIKSLPRWIDIGKFSYTKPGRILRPRKSKTGYCSVTLYSRLGYKKSFYVHRLVAQHFCDGDHSREVNHKDGDKANNCASNLEFCTRSANNLHALDLGRRKSGEAHPQARLSNEDVQWILVWCAAGFTHTAVSRAFGVSRQQIGRIVAGTCRVRERSAV